MNKLRKVIKDEKGIPGKSIAPDLGISAAARKDPEEPGPSDTDERNTKPVRQQKDAVGEAKTSVFDTKIKKFFRVLLVILICIIIAAFVLFKINGGALTVSSILHYTPSEPLLAAMVLWGLFILKSFTIVFPLSVLCMTSGVLFETPVALAVSLVGICLTATGPFILGRFFGSGIAGELREKYPKLQTLHERQSENGFFICFFIRALGILPCDIISLYFGSVGLAYPVYLGACALGFTLDVATYTILGAELEDPLSPMFLSVLAIRLVIAITSLLLYRLISAKKRTDAGE